jgi:activator of HSP90 ATPase
MKSITAKPSRRKTRTIRQNTLIPATPVEVYDAFINARKHRAFTGAGATCGARVGGKFTAWDGYISGKILELDLGKRIVQEWRTTEWPEGAPPSQLDLSFKKKGNGTVISMIHSRVPAEQAAAYRKGWIDYYWNPLKKYFQEK